MCVCVCVGQGWAGGELTAEVESQSNPEGDENVKKLLLVSVQYFCLHHPKRLSAGTDANISLLFLPV